MVTISNAFTWRRASRARCPAGYALRGPSVDGDDGRAAEADVVLQRDLDAVDLALAGLTAQLPGQLRALRESGRAERVALADQAAARVHDRAVAAVGRRLVVD